MERSPIHQMLACLLLAVLVVAGFSQRAHSQDDTWREAYPAYYETMPPHAEDGPGANGYWHDPHLSWRNAVACYDFPPEEAGCMPLWMVDAEGLFLFRDPARSRPMATLGPSGPTVLGTNDFDSEFEAGLRATVARALGDWYRLEATFMGGYAWSDSVAVRNLDANGAAGNGNLFSPFSNFGNPPVNGLDYNDFAAIDFRSRLTSVELNMRRRLLSRPGRWESSFLVGVRYVNVNERFGYQTTTTTPAAAGVNYVTSTDNAMVGAQMGWTLQFLVRPRFWVDFDIKGGIFANRAAMDYALTQTAGGVPTNYAGGDTRDRTSFLGELSLDMHYQFASGWTFLAGYNAFWLTGVALAEDNFNTDINLLQLGPAQVVHNGEVVYHGPHIGLTWAY
ncbi:MAG TPA: hypothetical protein ENJ16_06450 [Planctomycetaceae bacterium]|nr:hypothetical protein [Planctomycetaceae bacterium]